MQPIIVSLSHWGMFEIELPIGWGVWRGNGGDTLFCGHYG
jgi:hypothetical protein